MSTEKFYSPLKIGLFIIALAYFLFAFHDVFTLGWIGEWNRIASGHYRFEIYAEDIIGGTLATPARLAAGIIGFSAVVYYFVNKKISKHAVYMALRCVFVLEAFYWLLSYLPSGIFETRDLFFNGRIVDRSLMTTLNSFTLNVLPLWVESIVIPIVLFILTFKLSPKKPLKSGLRWGMITGTAYVFVFWLLNTTLWISVIDEAGKGIPYLTTYPQNLLNFVLAAFGLLALGIYAVFLTAKSWSAQTLEDINLKAWGVVILSLGLYFLWNYLTWIYFGGWSDWYAWFLGHNENLWIMALPMLGAPMLFIEKLKKKNS